MQLCSCKNKCAVELITFLIKSELFCSVQEFDVWDIGQSIQKWRRLSIHCDWSVHCEIGVVQTVHANVSKW